MTDISRDPIINVVHRGVKQDIRTLLESGGLRGALLLMLSGIDTMAFLVMDDAKADVTRSDFIQWADRYMRFPCAEQVSGLELYAARCAALHAYGTESRLSREGCCRQIGWISEARREVVYAPQKHPDTVMVSIPALVRAFFAGIDTFLVDTFADPVKAARAEKRFKKLMYVLPGPARKGDQSNQSIERDH